MEKIVKSLYHIEQRNKFSVNCEEIEVMRTNGENLTVTVRKIVDEKRHCFMESAPHQNSNYILMLE